MHVNVKLKINKNNKDEQRYVKLVLLLNFGKRSALKIDEFLIKQNIL